MIAVCTHTVSADEYLTPNTSNLANTFITVDLSTTPSDDFNAPTDDSGRFLMITWVHCFFLHPDVSSVIVGMPTKKQRLITTY